MRQVYLVYTIINNKINSPDFIVKQSKLQRLRDQFFTFYIF